MSNTSISSNPNESAHDVAVIGCGVVGLVAALVLASSGFKVLVVGARPPQFQPDASQRFDPRVFALSHRSQRVLDRLRVWDNIPSEKVQAVSEMQVWGDSVGDAQGYLRFNASDTGVDYLTWIIEQSCLFDVLFAAMRYQPGIDWLDARVEGLSREKEGWAVVTNLKTVRVPLLIAADGAQSQTRKQAGLDFSIDDYSAEGVVTTFAIEKPHHGTARQWFSGDSILAMLPLPGPHVSMVWSMPLSQSQALMQANPVEMVEKVKAFSGAAVHSFYGDLVPVGKTYAFTLKHGVAPVWFDNGVVLMGDAAHVIHPLAGQGLNLGLEDAAELANLLTSRKRLLAVQRLGLADEQLWQAWERRRKAACTPVHFLTDGLHTLFRLDLPGAAWARNKGMRLVNQLPMLKRWLSQQAMR
ncbi:FAD-dependent monooxygenase [Limnobacter parvus]|uniref:FAD-dependent monooxygenase n=1 Tax=Limnobacter parvus TaxID=2939690 RepID=A0ABT1XCP2_9BURK|nr:FAD-dependent monooxygenase [Limnobacter parvus]MCR2745045.1 FAD-dependent monooxygenase [Limnobacter parvus]